MVVLPIEGEIALVVQAIQTKIARSTVPLVELLQSCWRKRMPSSQLLTELNNPSSGMFGFHVSKGPKEVPVDIDIIGVDVWHLPLLSWSCREKNGVMKAGSNSSVRCYPLLSRVSAQSDRALIGECRMPLDRMVSHP
jgi:hypothetical protein